MNIYWTVLLITAILSIVFKHHKKVFIISTSFVHIFVCGFRYKYMHGDLQKYAYEFNNISNYGWRSKELIRKGRNTLFYILNKFVAEFFNDNFQVLLFIIAVISTLSIAWIIYRYSTMPFLSFLVWSCFGFYMFSFYSIKQTLAMAIVMIAAIGILEDNLIWFLIFSIIAGLVHFPAFVFLPSYFLCKLHRAEYISATYLLMFLSIFFARNKLVYSLSDLYYESERFSSVTGGIGGKCIMMIGLLMAGYFLCGFSDQKYRKIFILISLASLLQLFSVYDNVFTRLADYYFQFIILFAPYMLSQVHQEPSYPRFYFNERSQIVLVCIFVVLSLLFYQTASLSVSPEINPTDNLLNYHFMWDKDV